MPAAGTQSDTGASRCAGRGRGMIAGGLRMAQGDVLRSKKREYREPATGVKVAQLTDAPCHNVHPYYNQEGFVGGSERYVFASNRSGIGQIYSVETGSGKIVQLTDSEDPPDGSDGNASQKVSRRRMFSATRCEFCAPNWSSALTTLQR